MCVLGQLALMSTGMCGSGECCSRLVVQARRKLNMYIGLMYVPRCATLRVNVSSIGLCGPWLVFAM